MNFAQPLALLGLFAVPAVVALHLYRRRLAERRVAALFLFDGQVLAADAGRTRSRLLRTPSLWLECAAAALLSLWLAGPSFGELPVRHVVLVLDDSASMAAGRTRDEVLAALAERLRGLASADRITILRTGPRPTVLLGPRALPGEAAAVLAGWQPAQPRHDPLPSLDLARELCSGGGEVVFATDEPLPPGTADVAAIGCGEPLPNCALLLARRERTGTGEQLRLRLASYAGATATELLVRAGDRELAREPVVLQDGFADRVVPLPAGTGAVDVELAADALPLDDRAVLLPLPPRTVAVADLLPAELAQRLQLRRVFAALADWRPEPEARRAELVLSDRPGALLAGQTEVVIAAGDGERQAWDGPFVIDRAHPWLAGVQLQGVVWRAGRRELPGRVLVAVGDQALLSEEEVGHGRRLWIDLDPTAGNAVRAPDWPVLFANLLEHCRQEVPGPVAVNVALGDEARYRRSLDALAADRELWLEGPDGSRREGRGDRTVGWPIDRPGLHRVLGRDGQQLAQFAARFFDPAESDLAGRRRFVQTPPPGAAAARGGAPLRDTSLPQRLLALLVLVAVAADWWWLGRRRP